VRQSYFEGPAYVPLLRRAYEGWHELAEESGRDLLRLCGGIYIGDPKSRVFTGSLASARLHGWSTRCSTPLRSLRVLRPCGRLSTRWAV
jgi:hypothetical protein